VPRLIRVDDPDDERLDLFHRNERALMNRAQKRTDGSGLFLAEGDLVVERALDAGCVPVAALVDAGRVPDVAARFTDVPVYAGGDALRARVTGMGVPQPVIAVFERPHRCEIGRLVATASRLVLLEAVDNPANVGSVVRNAAALGWDGLVIDGTSADPLARRALRVSMGHAIAFPHARIRELAPVLADLRELGFRTVALALGEGSVPIHDLDRTDRVAIVVGSERTGLSPVTSAACDVQARIPMHRGIDSLNAAAATAVACYTLGPSS
jgi:tRNA G18 (ribose-2'-O)-methylase SpoU